MTNLTHLRLGHTGQCPHHRQDTPLMLPTGRPEQQKEKEKNVTCNYELVPETAINLETSYREDFSQEKSVKSHFRCHLMHHQLAINMHKGSISPHSVYLQNNSQMPKTDYNQYNCNQYRLNNHANYAFQKLFDLINQQGWTMPVFKQQN